MLTRYLGLVKHKTYKTWKIYGKEITLTFIISISCLHLPTFRSQAAIVSEKSTVFTFSHREALATKFDLAVKQVKVTRGSSFEQIMMGWSPQCYIPSFVEIGLLVQEKIFKGFLPYVGMEAILVMGPATCHQTLISLYMKAFLKNLVQIGKVVSEKIQFEFLYVHNLGPRSRKDLDLQYSHTFIYSIR